MRSAPLRRGHFARRGRASRRRPPARCAGERNTGSGTSQRGQKRGRSAFLQKRGREMVFFRLGAEINEEETDGPSGRGQRESRDFQLTPNVVGRQAGTVPRCFGPP